MNRRNVVGALLAAPVVGSAAASPIDWFNGVKLGSTLPEFDAEYINPRLLADAKLTLIDFWATWCAPCREEFPRLNAIYAKFNSQGLEVVGLTQEPRAVAEAFLPKVSLQYAVGAGGNKPLQKQLGIKALPYALLVDRSRKVIWRGQASGLSDADLEGRLKSAA